MTDEEHTQLPLGFSTKDIGAPNTPDTNGGQNEKVSGIKPKPKKSIKARESEVAEDNESLGSDDAVDAALKSVKAPKTKTPRGKGKAGGDKVDTPTKKRAPKSTIKADGETNLAYESDKVSTPRKKRASTSIPKNDSGEPSTPPTKKRRAPAATPTLGRSIPESRDKLGDDDKMLLDLKEQGKTWPEIREAFRKIGIITGSSTLPNRYSRLTAKLVEWKAGDIDIFMAAKATVEAEHLEAKKAMEAKFEAEKWGKISVAMEEMGADHYTSAALQKKFKDLTTKGYPVVLGSSDGGPNGTSSPTGLSKTTSGTSATAASGQREGGSDDSEDV
ncbi:hypothetical protein GP486_004241 [Trichoglossum hirsutum]|uniref:Myb-like domain-containing protein n=1 Tax=Trichoglossum hirsutum TaxID=265104 RepID=A0A9P8RPG3_9PEZI|nr:hypothetical protein GP486_004241 [Trichoglossum hirsutum]